MPVWCYAWCDFPPKQLHSIAYFWIAQPTWNKELYSVGTGQLHIKMVKIFSSILVHFLCKHVTIGHLLPTQRSSKQFAAAPLQVSNAITSLLHLLHHLLLSAVLDWTCWQWGHSRQGWIKTAKTHNPRAANKLFFVALVQLTQEIWNLVCIGCGFSFHSTNQLVYWCLKWVLLQTYLLLFVFWSNVCQMHINLVVLRC